MLGTLQPSREEISMRTATFVMINSFTLATLLAFTAFDADAAGRTTRRGVVATVDGGIAAGQAVGYRTPNGGAGVRGRAVATDGKGDATAVSGAAGRTANGGVYGRAGTTTVNANGAVSHRSGAAARGPNGTAKSSGAF